MNILCGFVFF